MGEQRANPEVEQAYEQVYCIFFEHNWPPSHEDVLEGDRIKEFYEFLSVSSAKPLNRPVRIINKTSGEEVYACAVQEETMFFVTLPPTALSPGTHAWLEVNEKRVSGYVVDREEHTLYILPEPHDDKTEKQFHEVVIGQQCA